MTSVQERGAAFKRALVRLGALSQRVVVLLWGLRMGDICVLGSKRRGSPALRPGRGYLLPLEPFLMEENITPSWGPSLETHCSV